jgi:uncharacterized protein (DUF2141 family)
MNLFNESVYLFLKTFKFVMNKSLFMARRKSDIGLILLIAFLTILTFQRCAKVVAPTGGARDTIPPVPLESEPPNYSTNFDSKEIEIEFNEFLQFDKMQQQFIASPPFEEDPEINLKGKEVEIKLWGALDGNTTYTLNFGNAIQDFTEGNPLKNYRYVFSTGDFIDSMAIAGVVKEALTHKPVEDALVMLYDNLSDSIPYREIPNYVSRTDEEGQFLITNIRKDTFKLFAIQEKNNNYLYDSYSEKIAFTDTLITFEEKLFEEYDTVYVQNDSIQLKDSIIDTVKFRSYYDYPVKQYALRLFEEDKGEQYLRSSSRPEAYKVDVYFNRPVRDSLKVNIPDSISHENKWYYKEINSRRDTFIYWLTDSSLYLREYLPLHVTYKKKDSLNRDIWVTDSLELRYVSQDEKWMPDSISLSPNIKNNTTIDLNQRIKLYSKIPVLDYNSEGFKLSEQVDSVYKKVSFTDHLDSSSFHNIFIKNKWKSQKKYQLIVEPETVNYLYNMYQKGLDTIQFTTRKIQEYGDMILNITNIDTTCLVHLLHKKENKIIRSAICKGEDKDVKFDYLNPGEYRIRLIIDANENGKWDTGDYLKHKQPERVIYFDEKIEIRANWDHEFQWDLKNVETKNKP